jgi:predicted ArsR family transcriptional regulator
MDRDADQGVRARRHRLLGDPRRLAIVEALKEGPRQIPELARLLGIHPTTVRAHLEKLREAGVLEEEPGVPTGRGRPSKHYRLREPLLAGDPEVRLFVGGLVALLRTACGEGTVGAVEEEGARRGRELGRSLRHPSVEQAVHMVVETLERLSFAPSQPIRQKDLIAVEVRHCPFGVDPRDPDGAVICAFHEGLVRGLAEVTSGQDVAVRLLPFVAPGRCRVDLCFDTGPQKQSETPSVETVV